MASIVVLLWLFFFASVDRSEAQECTLEELTSQFLRIRIENLIIALGGEGSNVNVVLQQDGILYTCLAQGNREGTYRELSVILTYTRPNVDSMIRARQFELDCIGAGSWQERSGSLSNNLVGTFPSYVNISSLTNCSGCDENAGNVNHCEACDEACDIGLMRCTGPTSEDCCVAFNPADRMCSPDFEFQCDGEPCANDGTCIPEMDGYICVCPEGFTGVNCTINIDDCADEPCKNGSTCIDGINEYSCICAVGFTGVNCGINIDDCADAPCKNGSTCIDGINEYRCLCADGFTGVNCDVNIDDCADEPCKNGSTCIDGINEYRCICAEGFTGVNCDINIDDCADAPCKNGSTCVDGINEYRCICADGFTGFNCDININDCADEPCKNGSTCIDEINNYRCICANGFTGINCDINIDDCIGNPCLNNGTCNDMVGDYSCVCAEGFTGENCAIVINECDNEPCKFNSTCVNESPGYSCICSSGYTGRNCDIDIDECLENPCLNGGTCINAPPGQFTCNCPPNYTGSFCETIITLYEYCAQRCPQKTLFDRGLCIFYCQLREWRIIANRNGFHLPVVRNDDESSSDQDRWQAALTEQKRFSKLWTMNAERQNIQLTKEDQLPPMTDNTISQWEFSISEHKDYLQSWRDYIRGIDNDPPLVFTNIPDFNIEQDASQEELSNTYSNYSKVWSNDVSSYVTEFDNED